MPAVLEIDYIKNHFTCSGNGACFITFAALPDGKGGYLPSERLDRIPGALITQSANICHGTGSSYLRHSSGTLEIELPVGTIVKEVAAHASSHRHKQTRGWIVAEAGELEHVDFIGNRRKAGGGWETVFSVDGNRISIS
jgi:hypothetical protein